MDFWSRLIGGGALPPTKQPNANNPQQRLGRFKRATEYLQQLWRKPRNRAIDTSTAGNLRTCLDSITRILHDESRTNAPHLCFEHAASVQIYKPATDLAISSSNEGIARGTLGVLNALIDSEESNLLDDPAFSSDVTIFAKRISTSGVATLEIQGLLFEVLFGVAAKLRLQPKLLRCWFKPGEGDGDEALSISGKTVSDPGTLQRQFPLFYLLLDHVHHDGRVGEFARTGLLYIIESAARSDGLEKWIVESDLATLMASGLGALKLIFSYSKQAVPMIVAFSDEVRPTPTFDAVETSSSDFQEGLRTFLAYLVFWQDILENCTSHDVKQTLLDHFDFLFVKQLLYPSLLESSDVDGGSVAVLTYLRSILLTINHADLSHRTLHYLLALPKRHSKDIPSSRPATLARRRKSESLIHKQAASDEELSPGLFTLLDMILSGIRCNSQQTVAAALRLLGTILDTRHEYALPGLLRANKMESGSPKRSISVHDYHIDTLLNMADSLTDEDDENIYDLHLQDVRILIESHGCSTTLLPLPSTSVITDVRTEPIRQQDWPNQVEGHTIEPSDPLLQSLLFRLDQFFSNDVETNLTLTRAFSVLASCGHTCLDDWFTKGLDETEFLDSNEEASAVDHDHEHETASCHTTLDHELRFEDSHSENGALPQSMGHTSSVFTSLKSLVQQVNYFEQQIKDFKIYLAERKHIFKVGEEIENVLKDAPALPSTPEGAKPVLPDRLRASGQATVIPERLKSGENSANTSRASSPRGRQITASSASTLVSRLSHLRISPSPNPSKRSSAHNASPLRKSSFSSTPSKISQNPTGPAGALHQKIKIPFNVSTSGPGSMDTGSDEVSSTRSSSVMSEIGHSKESVEVSLSQILTNVLILQEFLLELAAIIEVRASLFDEVEFV